MRCSAQGTSNRFGSASPLTRRETGLAARQLGPASCRNRVPNQRPAALPFSGRNNTSAHAPSLPAPPPPVHHHGTPLACAARARHPTQRPNSPSQLFSAKKDGTGGNTCLSPAFRTRRSCPRKRRGRPTARRQSGRLGLEPMWMAIARLLRFGRPQALASWHWHDYTSFWLAVSLHVSSAAGTAGRYSHAVPMPNVYIACPICIYTSTSTLHYLCLLMLLIAWLQVSAS